MIISVTSGILISMTNDEQRLVAFEQMLREFDWFCQTDFGAVCSGKHPLVALVAEREELGEDGRSLYSTYCPF